MIDYEKIGRFIAECRKSLGLTQKQLGEFLDVSDKAVSKWENGRSLPDVALIEPMCNLFQISMSELLSGEKIEPEKVEEKTNQILLEAVRDRDVWGVQIVLQLFYIGGMMLWFLPFYQMRGFHVEKSFINIMCWIIGLAILYSYSYLDQKLKMRYYRNSSIWINVITSTVMLLIIVSKAFIPFGGQTKEDQFSVAVFFLIMYLIMVVLIIIRTKINKRKSQEEE